MKNNGLNFKDVHLSDLTTLHEDDSMHIWDKVNDRGIVIGGAGNHGRERPGGS